MHDSFLYNKGYFIMTTVTTNHICRVDNETNVKSETSFGEPNLHNPNHETVEAMLEAERIVREPNAKKYPATEDALAELRK